MILSIIVLLQLMLPHITIIGFSRGVRPMGPVSITVGGSVSAAAGLLTGIPLACANCDAGKPAALRAFLEAASTLVQTRGAPSAIRGCLDRSNAEAPASVHVPPAHTQQPQWSVSMPATASRTATRTQGKGANDENARQCTRAVPTAHRGL
jgi:hypothetical protein